MEMQKKRYNTLDNYYKNKYGCKVFKVSLNLGLSCPNIDGTKGFGGCIYCKNGGNSFVCDDNIPLRKQFEKQKEILHKKWKDAKYIAYFGNNTNTYGDIDYLRKCYFEVLDFENVLGVNISTRCDAISDECLSLLCELNKKTDLVIELGLQSIHEKTSHLINRGHSLDEFYDMYKKLTDLGIKVVVHLIMGLPFETYDDMMESIRYVNKLKPFGVKLHMLHILNGTPLLKLYEKEKFHILSKDEYVKIVCDSIENLNPDTIINRITGDPNKEDLIEPKWLVKKFTVLNDIDKLLKKRDTYQGFNLSILNRARLLMSTNLKPNDIVIDATVGNGKDSLFLLNTITSGHLFGFDINKEAISRTDKLLKDNNFSNYTLYNKSHSLMFNTLKSYTGKISLIVFNLGYLPHSKEIIPTNYKTTLKAIKDSLKLLNKKGHIVLTIYPGHKEGLEESIKIKEFLDSSCLDYVIYRNTDKDYAPYVIDIRNKK